MLVLLDVIRKLLWMCVMQIKELESENRTLRDRNLHLEQQLENLDESTTNGPVTSHVDKS